MKQYAILKDALSDTNYGIALKTNGTVEFFGFNEQSCQWAEWANQKSLDVSQIPDGISINEFTDLTENIAKQFNFKIDDSSPLETKSITGRVFTKNIKNTRFMESKSLTTISKTPSISDIPLGEFANSKPLVIAFKVAAFKNDILRSEIALKSRFNQLAFNLETNKFNPRPNSNFKGIEFDRLNKKFSAGAQRRFGKKIVEQINSDISFSDTEIKFPGEFILGFVLGKRRGRKKRNKISPKTAEILDFHQKGIGRAIGNQIGGAARRTSIPNERGRGGRGISSRIIAGVLDPRERRDVDGDGMIFDGTWREMPDPTRFKPEDRGGLRSQNRTPWVRGDGGGSPPNRVRGEALARQREALQTELRIAEEEKRTLGYYSQQGQREVERAKKRRNKYKKEIAASRALDNDEAKTPSKIYERRMAGESLEDVAESLGISREEVRKLEQAHMRRMRDEEANTPNRGLRSQSSQNSNSRRAIATTQRAATPRGLASRTPKISGKRRPGVDKVDPSDGKLWETLTPEQKKTVETNLLSQLDAITKELKTSSFKGWWGAQVRGAKKQTVLGGRFAPRDNDESFNNGDITEMQRLLDINKKISTTSRRQIQRKIDSINLLSKMKEGNDYSLLEHLHPTEKGKLLKELGDDPSFKAPKGFNAKTESTIFGVGAGLTKDKRNQLEDAAKSITSEDKKLIDDLLEAAAGGNDFVEPLLKKLKTGKKFTPAEEKALLEEFNAQPEIKKQLQAILNAKKKNDAKQVSFRSRILRVNPERARKRELRRQRASGQVRRNAVILDPAQQIKKRKLRAAAFKRQVLSKFRKNKNAEELSESLGQRKIEQHPVLIAPDGKVTITPQFSNILSLLDERLEEKKTGGDKAYDKLLATLWENFGYSETPVLVNKEEVASLLAAGWQPVIRGTGSQAVESESYVEQFLTNPGRFIPGQGARAYGVGEYFAFPGGNWTGYSGGAEDKHSMLVLIPPSANIMTRDKLDNERRDMANLSTLIHNQFVTAGGRDMTEAMSPGELAQLARKGAPKLEESKTISGQILNQLVSRLEELENSSDDTSIEKVQILKSLDYLQRFSKNEEVGQFAPIIGVDAIDTNDNNGAGSPLLLHNRSIIAAFQTPMTRKDAEEMSGGVVKTWDKWKKKDSTTVAAPVGPTVSSRVKPRLVRRPKQNTNSPTQGPVSGTPNPNTPAQNSAGGIPNSVDTSSWVSSTPSFRQGSNPAELLTAPDGTQYYAKKPKPNEPLQQSIERMETEVLASKLYELAGVQAAELSLGDRSGEPRMLSQMITARMPSSSSDQDAARAGFVVDAWLANWDAPLNDNIKFDSNNNPVRLDVGGSLDYRAQGGKKETTSTPFGDTVGEIMSMQKNGNINFSNIDTAEIKKQAIALSSVADDKIRATVSAIVSDPQRAAKLTQTLINRRDDIVARYGR